MLFQVSIYFFSLIIVLLFLRLQYTMLGVSPSTVKRGLRQYGLCVSASFAVMTDEDLDQIDSAIVVYDVFINLKRIFFNISFIRPSFIENMML